MIFEIIVAITFPPILYFIYTYINHICELKNFPKGPFPLPVIGNLHLLSKNAYRDFASLTKEYGDVFGFSFGMNRYVIINNYEGAKDSLLKIGSSFAARPNDFATYKLLSRGNLSMTFSEDKMWRLQRKLMHSALKVYGENFEILQRLVKKEGEHLVKSLLETNGGPVNPVHEIGCAVLNVICQITFGCRYQCNDEEFLAIQKFQRLIFDGLKSTDAVMFFPWMKYFSISGLNLLKKGIAIRDPILRRHVAEHIEKYDPNNIRDFTDGLIALAGDEVHLNKYGLAKLTRDHLEMMTNDIFVGGNETTTTTMIWFVVYMLRWPQFQDEIYKEIINTFEGDEYPTYNDREKTPLTHACLLEVLRLSSIAPLGVPRKSVNDCVLRGQKVPKNTPVFINFWNIHTDKRYWKHPEDFDPYRWLDRHGKVIDVTKKESYFPYSAGMRGCPGENLANMEVFLLISIILKHFRIEKPDNEPLPSLEGNMGITLTPLPFTACFTPRNNNVELGA